MTSSNRIASLLPSALLVLIGYWIYYPCLTGGWIWDDTMLVTDNDTLRSLSGLGRIWFAAPSTDYWPVTWTFLWIEYQLWGLHTLGYHLCSVTLHIVSAFLIWRLLDRLGLRWRWLGALIFLVHPLAVESVAWISEIKNTLSLPFFLLSLLAFIDADQKQKPQLYTWAFVFYLLAMLSKSSTIMLPFDLLLYLWWRHGRVTGADFARIIPYFVIAVILGLVTLYFQINHYDENEIVRARNVFERIVGGATAIFFYLGKFYFPLGLLPMYPRWSLHPPSIERILILPVLLLILAAFWSHRKTWGRHGLLAFGFFLINLLPVIGLTHMTWMNISWVADHLVYLPMIGLIGGTVAALELLSRHLRAAPRAILLSLVTALILLMMAESRGYAAMFINIQTLATLKITRSWSEEPPK